MQGEGFNRDIATIRARVADLRPDVLVRQLQVRHPGADDDGLWFFCRPGFSGDVQLESNTGNFPFLVEGTFTDERFTVASVDEAVDLVTKLLFDTD